MEYRIAKHVQDMLDDRKVPRQLFDDVLKAPEQVVADSHGNLACPSRVTIGSRTMLLRMIVDVYTAPPTVVTVYLTSKLEKYWSRE